MKEIKTEIDIHSSPEKVWRILTDFSKYPEWNPFIDRISGELKEGSKLVAHITPHGSRDITIKAIFVKIDPNKELRWTAQGRTTRLFNGEHFFTMDSIGNDNVKFTHGENFTGILIPLLSRRLNKAIYSYEAMNKALKAQVEK